MNTKETGTQFEWITLSRGLGWYRTAVIIFLGITILFVCTSLTFLAQVPPATVCWILTGYAIASAGAVGVSAYALSLCRRAQCTTGVRQFAWVGFLSALVATTLSIAGAVFLAVIPAADYLTDDIFNGLRFVIGVVSDFAIYASVFAFFVVMRRIARYFDERRAARLAVTGIVCTLAVGTLSVLERLAPQFYAAIPFAAFVSLGGWVAVAVAVGRAVPTLRRRIAAAAL